MLTRHRSSGDGRRRYVHLETVAFTPLEARPLARPASALFVCTHNSARSQLAAALWTKRTGQPALDPVAIDTKTAFDNALHELDQRIGAFAGRVAS